MSPLPSALSHSHRKSHIVLFTVTVVDLVVFLKRAAAAATFATSKSSIGAFFCTPCRRFWFFLLESKPGVCGVLFLFLRLGLCVGVALTSVDGLIPVLACGDVDAAFATTPILAVSFGSIVVAPAASFWVMLFPLMGCERAQHVYDEKCLVQIDQRRIL